MVPFPRHLEASERVAWVFLLDAGGGPSWVAW